jgi:spermidine synthase
VLGDLAVAPHERAHRDQPVVPRLRLVRHRREPYGVVLKLGGRAVDDNAVEASEQHATVEIPAPLAGFAARATVALFGSAIFAAAALLFVVEPMVAKMLLPYFGGTSAVWAVSLVFFQAALLGGYAFAHYSVRIAGVRRQVLLQLALLLPPFAVLPIAVSRGSISMGGAPAVRLLVALCLAAGLPFFVVTTASPVLQRWFAAVGDARSRDPYFLYAAGNVGSMLALLAYPVLIEPRLTLAQQARLWTTGYSLFVLLAAVCAWRVLAAGPAAVAAAVPRAAVRPIGAPTALRWVALAALPSSLMLGTTSYISTDIAAVPLLWVIPLALYLLSFVLAFAKRQLLSPRAISWAVAGSSLLLGASVLPLGRPPVWAAVAIHGGNLFFVALMVHRRLALERPAPEQLTRFYLLLSLGGVCGGAFNALLAPLIFSFVAEYPIAIVLALLLRAGPRRAQPGSGLLRRNADLLLPFGFLVVVLTASKVLPPGTWAARGLYVAAVLLIAVWARRPVRFALAVGAVLAMTTVQNPALHAERTFFGVLRVEQSGQMHVFAHGTTVHGIESFAPGRRDVPLSYYIRQGPLGQIFARLPDRPRNVAVLGLGAGTTAAYGRPGDRFTFYEIDKAVVRIASNPRYFTYLHDSKAQIDIRVGDGRLELAKAPDSSYDLIVLDAFSSDSVPVHLLTREAVQVYLRKLRPGGLIAFHISNRYLDLEPVIDGVARSLGLGGLAESYLVTREAARRGLSSSIWAVVARKPSDLERLAGDHRWKPLRRDPGARVWTDEFSNILSVVRWTR